MQLLSFLTAIVSAFGDLIRGIGSLIAQDLHMAALAIPVPVAIVGAVLGLLLTVAALRTKSSPR